MSSSDRSGPHVRRVLAQAVGDVTAAAEPYEGCLALLGACMALTGASRGRVYFLRTDRGAFEPYAQIGRSDRGWSMRVADIATGPADRRPPLEQAALSRRPVRIWAPDGRQPGLDGATAARARLVVPVTRGDTCVGLVDLDAADPGALPDPDADDVEALLALVSMLQLLYDRRFVLGLLEHAQRPIDPRLGEHDFLSELMLLVAVSSGMEFAALREASDDGTLRCVGLWGFGDKVDRELWDLDPVRDYREFQRALNGETVVVRGLVAPEHDSLLRRPELRGVRSFVATPVAVGPDIFGVLSFALSLEYDFQPTEIRGFETLSNGVGVTLSNYRHFQQVGSDVAQYIEAATAITGVEVAQAARHEARIAIDACTSRLLLIEQMVRRVAPRRAAELVDELDGLEARLEDVKSALDKIKSATKAPKKAKEVVSLKQMWEQARSQLSGRLATLQVEARYDGPDVDVFAAPDWFRQVFLNLLLNSADAFATQTGARRGRRVVLQVERPTARSADLTATYSDNAGGINPSALAVPAHVDRDLGLSELVFLPDVTSKESGSGWGLALVRRILAEHHGSIDLVDHRRGVTFRLTVPRAGHEGDVSA